jgi:hypothetical protein
MRGLGGARREQLSCTGSLGGSTLFHCSPQLPAHRTPQYSVIGRQLAKRLQGCDTNDRAPIPEITPEQGHEGSPLSAAEPEPWQGLSQVPSRFLFPCLSGKVEQLTAYRP